MIQDFFVRHLSQVVNSLPAPQTDLVAQVQPTAHNSAESLDSVPGSDESLQPELEEVRPQVTYILRIEIGDK